MQRFLKAPPELVKAWKDAVRQVKEAHSQEALRQKARERWLRRHGKRNQNYKDQ